MARKTNSAAEARDSAGLLQSADLRASALDAPEGTTLPARAGLREWIGLATLSLACLVYVMDLTVLHLAVPTLSAELKPTSAQLLWIIDIYGFMVAGFLVPMGALGDRIGRRRLLLLGAVAFALTSALAAFSNSAETLILNRALMGVAGATIAPSTLSLIFNMFRDPKQRSLAVAVWISAFSAGSGIGPALGGITLAYFWWGSVFLLAIPVMALLLLLGPFVLPEYRDPKTGRIDVFSAVLSLGFVLPIIYSLKHTAQDGFDAEAISALVIGCCFGYLFIERQLKLDDPMLDLRLFRLRSFSAPLIVNVLTVFIAFGYFLFVAQYLQLALGLSPLVAGLWSIPPAIAMILSSNAAPRIWHNVRPSIVIGVSILLGFLGLVVLSLIGGPHSLALVVISSVIISLGLGPVFGLTTEMIVGSAPPERAGAASGVSETAAELGGALGISVLGSIGAAIYRRAFAEQAPGGISAEVLAVAQDTLGAAVEAAGQLPGPAGETLLAFSRAAFVDGMRVTVLLCAGIALVSAILAVTLLRDLGRPAPRSAEL